MFSAAALRPGETALLLVLYATMAALTLAGKLLLADASFVLLLLVFGSLLGWRVVRRADVPPPSFVLVGLALLCAAAGACLSIRLSYQEDAFFLAALQRLLLYQGFMLLPILGVGAFLLPRFFGTESRQNFPDSRTPPPGWTRQALKAGASGVLVILSFAAEAAGWLRAGPALRVLAVTWYLAGEVPFYRLNGQRGAPATILRLALGLMLAGFLAITIVPAYRVSLLHLTLIGGFALVTLIVATRVVYGHSGNAALLGRPNRWLWWMLGLMLLGMVTRISGDFWPKVLASHYSYGAVFWIGGVLIWSAWVLPKVLIPDADE